MRRGTPGKLELNDPAYRRSYHPADDDTASWSSLVCQNCSWYMKLSKSCSSGKGFQHCSETSFSAYAAAHRSAEHDQFAEGVIAGAKQKRKRERLAKGDYAKIEKESESYVERLLAEDTST